MLLRASIFSLLMSMALFGMAQQPAVGNHVASSEIRVRIPSYAIIQLAKNSPHKTVSAFANQEKRIEFLNPARGTIISNQKWILYIEIQAAPPAQQNKPDYTDTHIIYTTSPK